MGVEVVVPETGPEREILGALDIDQGEALLLEPIAGLFVGPVQVADSFLGVPVIGNLGERDLHE